MSDAFQTIYEAAHNAGMAAATTTVPTPMIVQSSTQLYYVEDGACGFAWVTIKGNTKFGRWAKKEKLARPQYPSGLCFRVSEFGQSVARKEEYAGAFAKVLRENGIEAHSGSRLD